MSFIFGWNENKSNSSISFVLAILFQMYSRKNSFPNSAYAAVNFANYQQKNTSQKNKGKKNKNSIKDTHERTPIRTQNTECD